MPTKKKVAKKLLKKKQCLKKEGDKPPDLKDGIVAGKDHVVEFAGEAFESIKEGVKHLVEKKKPKKTAKKKAAKKVAVKRAARKPAPKKAASKKAAPKKAAAKKAVHKEATKKRSEEHTSELQSRLP